MHKIQACTLSSRLTGDEESVSCEGAILDDERHLHFPEPGIIRVEEEEKARLFCGMDGPRNEIKLARTKVGTHMAWRVARGVQHTCGTIAPRQKRTMLARNDKGAPRRKPG